MTAIGSIETGQRPSSSRLLHCNPETAPPPPPAINEGTDELPPFKRRRGRPSKNPNNFPPTFPEHFNIWLQVILSQTLSSQFLQKILKNKDENFVPSLDTIDGYINRKLNVLKKLLRWKPDFLEWIDKRPHLSESHVPVPDQQCEVTGKESVSCCLQLYGPHYDAETLSIQEDDERQNCYLVSQKTTDDANVFHDLRHFKFAVFEMCKKKVQETSKSGNFDKSGLLQQVLNDEAWIKEMYGMFNEKVKSANTLIQSQEDAL